MKSIEEIKLERKGENESKKKTAKNIWMNIKIISPPKWPENV